MNKDAPNSIFRRELDALRRHGKYADFATLTQCALKAGLAGREAFDAIFDFLPRSWNDRDRSAEAREGLTAFINAFCDPPSTKRIAEYVSDNALSPFVLLDPADVRHITYFCRQNDYGKGLSELLAANNTRVLSDVGELAPDEKFEVIICQPTLGFRRFENGKSDRFGACIVQKLSPHLAQGGLICWISASGAVFDDHAAGTSAALLESGLEIAATMDLPPDIFPGTRLSGAIIVLRRGRVAKKLVGAIRNKEAAALVFAAFRKGPARQESSNWTWLDPSDQRNFAIIEQARFIKKLMPKGRHSSLPLRALLATETIKKADKPIEAAEVSAVFLYVPEYAGSAVTADLEETTVKPTAVYRLPIDPTKANPRFLARLLNSPFGRQIRQSIASGATIQRTRAADLMELSLPIPPLVIQEQIVRLGGDIGLLQATLLEMQQTLDNDWTVIADTTEKVDQLKSQLDIERRIAEWWRELPYPLATVYRRYQVSRDPKERLETLLHFFEIVAVFLATLGTSHVKVLRTDWEEVLGKWLHPKGGAGIDRSDFGFWIGLARASIKDASRISGDPELRESATMRAGPELVQLAGSIGGLGKTTEFLEVANLYRNNFKGHGGLLKASDAKQLDEKLQQPVRDLYEILAPFFRRFYLVRPGLAEGTDTGIKFETDMLIGSDPTFSKREIELDRMVKSNAMAFWSLGSRTMCRALPFFRLGAPQQPQETSVYVYNRVEKMAFAGFPIRRRANRSFLLPMMNSLGSSVLEGKARDRF